MAIIHSVRFEHYLPAHTLGIHETHPRLSWKVKPLQKSFQQHSYEVELSENVHGNRYHVVTVSKVISSVSRFVAWPFEQGLGSRQSILIRLRIQNEEGLSTAWSEPVFLEVGLLNRSDWVCDRITAPWVEDNSGPDTEALFRREFTTPYTVVSARLYITAQGVYEAEINGTRVGDYFLAPGWTAYEGRLQYQTYDITSIIRCRAG